MLSYTLNETHKTRFAEYYLGLGYIFNYLIFMGVLVCIHFVRNIVYTQYAQLYIGVCACAYTCIRLSFKFYPLTARVVFLESGLLILFVFLRV